MYELGSTTKAYTTTLVQILVNQGKMHWNETISDYFPEVHMDPRVGSLTLHEISTHTSGLPARPWNLPSILPSYEPYANYTMAQMLEFLRGLSPDHGGMTPRGQFIYCNDGFGLMGVMAERRLGKGYEDLLNEYIIDPLGHDTSVDRLTAEWHESGLPGVKRNDTQMSPGHDRYTGHVRIRRQPYGVYKANGALKSTAKDMMHWLQTALLAWQRPNETDAVTHIRANRTDEQVAVSLAMKQACEGEEIDCPTPPLAYASLNTNGKVGRAWQNYWSSLKRIVWKSGNTRGFATMKAYDWARGRAAWGFDTCGGCDENKIDKTVMMMLEGPPTPKPVPGGPVSFDRYVGTYYINSCTEQDVDHSRWYQGCQECHEHPKSIMETIEVSVKSGELVMQRNHWSTSIVLEPFEFGYSPSFAERFPASADPIGFTFKSPDRGGWINAEHRNKGRVPFIAIDNRLGAQEVYFVQGADGKAIDTLVLHSGGIDNFAVKDRSTLPVVVCGVGHGGWNGMCRGPP